MSKESNVERQKICKILNRDVMFANRRRKERLANTLCILNKLLETKKFIIDDQFTLADICVATQLLPVFGKDENKLFSQLQVEILHSSLSNCSRHDFDFKTKYIISKFQTICSYYKTILH